MKIVTILGARPQFINAGTASRAMMEQKQLETKNRTHSSHSKAV